MDHVYCTLPSTNVSKGSSSRTGSKSKGCGSICKIISSLFCLKTCSLLCDFSDDDSSSGTLNYDQAISLEELRTFNSPEFSVSVGQEPATVPDDSSISADSLLSERFSTKSPGSSIATAAHYATNITMKTAFLRSSLSKPFKVTGCDNVIATELTNTSQPNSDATDTEPHDEQLVSATVLEEVSPSERPVNTTKSVNQIEIACLSPLVFSLPKTPPSPTPSLLVYEQPFPTTLNCFDNLKRCHRIPLVPEPTVDMSKTSYELQEVLDKPGKKIYFVKLTRNNSTAEFFDGPALPYLPRRPMLDDSQLVLADAEYSRRRSRSVNSRSENMRKMRLRCLETRSSQTISALVDDMYPGLIKAHLQQAGKWNFNIFALDIVSGGRSLPYLCFHLFEHFRLFELLRLDPINLWKLFTLIGNSYHSVNPYHNSIHAADVTHALFQFLREERIKNCITVIDTTAAIIAAAAHDIDHPGFSQSFLICSSSHLTSMQKRGAILENHHVRLAKCCLLESGLFSHLPGITEMLSGYVESFIMATDISRHREFLSKLENSNRVGRQPSDVYSENQRKFLVQCALKCADISNPCREWELSKKWSDRVCQEFFRQGDFEARLKLPISDLCNRNSVDNSLARIQQGFFRFVAVPLFHEMHEFFNSPFSATLMSNLENNLKRWELISKLDSRKRHSITTTALKRSLRKTISMPVLPARVAAIDFPFLTNDDRFRNKAMRLGPNRLHRMHSSSFSAYKQQTTTRNTDHRKLATDDCEEAKGIDDESNCTAKWMKICKKLKVADKKAGGFCDTAGILMDHADDNDHLQNEDKLTLNEKETFQKFENNRNLYRIKSTNRQYNQFFSNTNLLDQDLFARWNYSYRSIFATV